MDPQQQIDDLKAKVDDLQLRIARTSQINLSDVLLDMRRPIDKARGIYSVVSSAPSAAPQDAFDQIQVYVNGATYRLYWYDWSAKAWHYVTATA